jgi:hypothetical protein
MGFGERNCLSQMSARKRWAERTSFSLPKAFGYFWLQKYQEKPLRIWQEEEEEEEEVKC